jgi:hypothetical protein
VQFSTAEKADFRPDPSAPARNLLHQVYYAQRDYKQKHGRWARTLAELGIESTGSEGVEMQVTQSGFEVVVQIGGAEGEPQRWHISQNSRVWGD